MAETTGSGQRKSLGAILLDCAIAGLITFVIAAPIMGLRTANTRGGMTLDQHWGNVLTAVLVVFFGRLVLQLFVWKPHGKRLRLLAARDSAWCSLGSSASRWASACAS
jgi:branched-chain amino acid transport system permease protein